MTIQQNQPENFLKIDSWAPTSRILKQQVWARNVNLIPKSQMIPVIS